MEYLSLSGLKSILEAMLLPPGGVVTCGLLGLLFWRRLWGRLLTFLALLSLYLLSTLYFMALMARSIESYPALSPQEIKSERSEAILVFMADLYTQAPELDGRDSISRLSMDRLSYAVLLHRKTGLPIILSGGPGNRGDLAVSRAGAEFLKNRFLLDVKAVEETSRSTWENALQSAQLLQDLGIKKVALVTHAWHMPRAIYSLQQAGVDTLPAPTRFVYRGMPPLTVATLIPTGRSLRNSCILVHEVVGLLWYKLRQYINSGNFQ